MFCALLTSRYQVSVYRTNGPLVSFLSSNYYYFGRHIDIKSIKLFDCLKCLSFPSMRENDNWIDLYVQLVCFILLRMCEQQIQH